MDGSLYTCFASAERSPKDEILRQYRVIAGDNELVVILNGVASMICVLNNNRQVVFLNKTILDLLNITDMHQTLGQRVGELFGCHHACDINGCGTSQYCSVCGALLSVLNCTKEKASIEECSMTNDETQVTFDLRVHSSHIHIYNENFIICSIFDIGNEKRRDAMERIFFHDIMNTVNGINGIATTMDSFGIYEQPMYMSYLTLLLNSLKDQINSHRVLTMAEKNEYQPEQHVLSSIDFVSEEVEKYRQKADTEAKEIRLVDNLENHTFFSDKILLSRVLGNMIKNALEAEQSGAVIDVGVQKDADGYLHFWVHNDSVMSEKDKLQVFNRSFSTKGQNRGLGTYSMKLLTEKYLKGVIIFNSNHGKGTVFTVKIPV